MPDYNPAVAAGINTAGPDISGTLNTLQNLQRTQAQTGLLQLQQLQQQRQYNALQAAAAAYRSGQDGTGAYLASGGDPAGAGQLQSLYSNQRFGAAHGDLNPQGAEANANIARAAAETNNLGVQNGILQTERATKDMQYRGGIAQSLYADPSDENWQTQTANLRGHVSPQGQAQIDAAKTPEQRRQVAASMIAAALPAGEANAPHNYSATEGVTTPLQTLAGGNQAPGVMPPQTGRLPMSPQAQEQAKAAGTTNIADIKAGNEKYENANNVQEGLLNIQNNLDKLPPGGYWTSGKDAGTRAALAKTVNTAMQVAGANPVFDPQKVAAAEAAQKGTVKLGFDLARSLGSREAAMIVQQSIGVQPGIEMTPEGNHRIMTSLMVAAQRDKDEAMFQHQYLKQNPDALPGDASMAFNQAHPPSEYVSNVNRLLQIPKAKVDLLRANPDKANDFDTKYGSGMSRFLLAR